MTLPNDQIFTIGHSTQPFERFAQLLEQHSVTAIADVRSRPYSRFNPQFNRESLQQTLKGRGVRYVFLGHELGARSSDPSCYENGRVQYDALARTEVFQSGIERVMRGSHEYRIALMCAEKEPLECHRTVLVARALADRGVEVTHILANGNLESHEATMDRLLKQFGKAEDLYMSKEELLLRALYELEKKIAYVDQKQLNDEAVASI